MLQAGRFFTKAGMGGMSDGGRYALLIASTFVMFVLTLGARRAGLPSAAASTAGGTALALLPGLVPDPDLVLPVFLPHC